MTELPLGVSQPIVKLKRRTKPPADSPLGWIDAMSYGILILGSLAFLLPILFLFTGSLQSHSTSIAGRLHLIPNEWMVSNYPAAAAEMHFTRSLANTIFITALTMLGQIISGSLVGFGFARFKFPGRDALFLIMLATLMLPAQVTIIPQFLLFRSLGWVNSFLPLIVPAWFGAPFFIFLFRQAFLQIPDELIEAARLDGASWWKIYYRLILPLCKPVITVVAIYSFLAAWNDYLNPLVYLNDPSHATLALALASFKGEYGVTRPEYLLAATALTMLPCLVLFSLTQRLLVRSADAEASGTLP